MSLDRWQHFPCEPCLKPTWEVGCQTLPIVQSVPGQHDMSVMMMNDHTMCMFEAVDMAFQSIVQTSQPQINAWHVCVDSI